MFEVFSFCAASHVDCSERQAGSFLPSWKKIKFNSSILLNMMHFTSGFISEYRILKKTKNKLKTKWVYFVHPHIPCITPLVLLPLVKISR